LSAPGRLSSKDIIMNDNTHWPVMGRAAASRAAKVLAHYASWQLAEVAADYGLPLAGFLHEEASALLVAVTDGALAPAAAMMNASLIATRSDGLIISETLSDAGAPQVAFGLWWSGVTTWHVPMLPWLGEDDVMWLAPGDPARGVAADRAFRLVARRIRGDFLPWRTGEERLAGLARAAAALARGEKDG
jgi:hypothetical protein